MDALMEYYENNPTALIHDRLAIQISDLTEFGEEIIALINESLVDCPAIYAMPAGKAIRNIWFWTLAAYEVTRTLHQWKNLFIENTASQLGELKGYLATLRMPLAKFELKNNGPFVKLEGSMTEVDCELRDFIFTIGSESINFKRMYARFVSTYSNIKPADINAEELRKFIESYR